MEVDGASKVAENEEEKTVGEVTLDVIVYATDHCVKVVDCRNTE